MIILYKVTVFEKNEETMIFISPKSRVFKRLNDILSSECMTKDITFKIELAQQ